MHWSLIVGVFVGVPGTAGDLDLALTSLEAAYAAQPEPSILLAIADLEEKKPKGCEKTLATYRRFFEACPSCPSLSHAVARFDEVIARCVMDIGEETALREKLTIPKAPQPERHPGDATRREVVDLMLEARKLDWAEGMRGLVTMAEVGSSAKPAFLNQQRVRAWEVLRKKPASAEQVLWVRPVHPEGHQQALAEILRKGVMRHEQWGKQSAEGGKADNDGADPGGDILPAASHALRRRGSSRAFIMSASMVRPT